jgi:segregation and condensation protein B
MSLKAKIEAVIYASEEPVTLGQLVSLLGQEAQAELDRAAEAQQTLALDEVEADGVTEPTHGDEAAMNGAPSSVDGAHGSVDEASGVVDGALDLAAAVRAEKTRAAKLRGYFREVLDRLIAEYAAPELDRGLEIREVAGGFRIATKPEYHDAVRGFVKSLKPPLKLTLQALETLAVVAYKQPVTSPEISEIRGVDSSGVLGSLIARKLITTAGRKQVIGRPILYKTTKEFLLKFGLKDVAELPSIEEFEKMAGQMAEQEDIPMEHEAPQTDYRAPEVAEELGPETEGYEPHLEEREPADNVAPEDRAGVDGRISSLPPKYDEGADDPSAQEAEIQEREQS